MRNAKSRMNSFQKRREELNAGRKKGRIIHKMIGRKKNERHKIAGPHPEAINSEGYKSRIYKKKTVCANNTCC